MIIHIGHLAVSALFQPAAQVGFVSGELGSADLGLLKA
jgi:hypothetical protein